MLRCFKNWGGNYDGGHGGEERGGGRARQDEQGTGAALSTGLAWFRRTKNDEDVSALSYVL